MKSRFAFILLFQLVLAAPAYADGSCGDDLTLHQWVEIELHTTSSSSVKSDTPLPYRQGDKLQGTPKRDDFRNALAWRNQLPVAALLLRDGSVVEGRIASLERTVYVPKLSLRPMSEVVVNYTYHVVTREGRQIDFPSGMVRNLRLLLPVSPTRDEYERKYLNWNPVTLSYSSESGVSISNPEEARTIIGMRVAIYSVDAMEFDRARIIEGILTDYVEDTMPVSSTRDRPYYIYDLELDGGKRARVLGQTLKQLQTEIPISSVKEQRERRARIQAAAAESQLTADYNSRYPVGVSIRPDEMASFTTPEELQPDFRKFKPVKTRSVLMETVTKFGQHDQYGKYELLVRYPDSSVDRLEIMEANGYALLPALTPEGLAGYVFYDAEDVTNLSVAYPKDAIANLKERAGSGLLASSDLSRVERFGSARREFETAGGYGPLKYEPRTFWWNAAVKSPYTLEGHRVVDGATLEAILPDGTVRNVRVKVNDGTLYFEITDDRGAKGWMLYDPLRTNIGFRWKRVSGWILINGSLLPPDHPTNRSGRGLPDRP